MVTSDDVLILCVEYCMINDKLTDKLVNQLSTCVSERLSDEKGVKSVRSYYYSKDYLLFSNICMVVINYQIRINW